MLFQQINYDLSARQQAASIALACGERVGLGGKKQL